MELECPDCHAVVTYTPRAGTKIPRATCCCGYKFRVSPKKPKTTIGSGKTTVAKVGPSRGTSIGPPVGPLPGATPATAEPNPTPLPAGEKDQAATLQAGLDPAEAGKYIRSLGIELWEINIIKDMHRGGIQQSDIARQYNRDRYWISRLVHKWIKLDLIAKDPGCKGAYVANPMIFPWARPLVPAGPGPASTSPPSTRRKKVQSVCITCEVAPGSMARYTNDLRPGWNLQPHKGNGLKNWDKRVIDEPKLAAWMFRKCGYPKFKPTSTTGKIIFYTWGYGTTAQERKEDAWRTGKEMHDMLENMFGIELGFKTGDPSQYEHVMEKQRLITGTIQGVAVRADHSPTHEPGAVQASGDHGGTVIDELGQIADKFPFMERDLGDMKNGFQALVTQISDSVKNAVAQGIAAGATTLAATIQQAVAQGIQQGLQATQPQAVQRPAQEGLYK